MAVFKINKRKYVKRIGLYNELSGQKTTKCQ